MAANKSLKKLPIDTTIYTDASLDGWWGGMWTKQEPTLHINAK